jgi:hypothetical protein
MKRNVRRKINNGYFSCIFAETVCGRQVGGDECSDSKNPIAGSFINTKKRE